MLPQNRAGTYSRRLNGDYRLFVRFIAKESSDEKTAKKVAIEVVAVEAIMIDEEQLAEPLEIVDYHQKKNFR